MEYLTMMVTFVPLILGGETVRNWLDGEFCPSWGWGSLVVILLITLLVTIFISQKLLFRGI